MDLHFEGNRLYYMEKEAELYRCLDYLSKELSEQEQMNKEQLWEVFHICADTAAVYRHITDYFTTLDRLILDARIKNGKLKQEVYDLKKENARLQESLERYMDEF
jgi:F420-0:gamma-glutamyl ligase-like protein